MKFFEPLMTKVTGVLDISNKNYIGYLNEN